MIANATEYAKMQEELRHLEEWLAKLHREHPAPAKGLTKAGVRKMIARLQEDLALFEGSMELEYSPNNEEGENEGVHSIVGL